MSDFCTPNAILSLKEYIIDNTKGETKALLEGTLECFLDELDEPLRNDMKEKLARIEKGERDIHF
jgi:2-iminoacetate synthase